MDIYTKLFFANWVLIMFVAGMDKAVLNDRLEENFLVPLGSWSVLTLCSCPAIMIYWIMS